MQKAGARHFVCVRTCASVCWSGRWTFERRASFFQNVWVLWLLDFIQTLSPREGKYIPLPQRVREGPRGGVRCSSSRGGRPGLSSLPPRGPHHLDNSSPGPGSETRGINGGEFETDFCGGPGRGGNMEVGRIIERT